MITERRGSLWSNTLVFLVLILFLMAVSSAGKAQANPARTSSRQGSAGQANNTPKSIPVTGGKSQANLSPPVGSAGGQATSQPLSGAYTVQAGDTLQSLALRFNTTVDALRRANPQTSSADPLAAGETLYIPGSTVLINDQTIYFVKSGDDLFAIAADHGVTLADLEQANPQIQPPALIFPGEQVKIPY